MSLVHISRGRQYAATRYCIVEEWHFGPDGRDPHPHVRWSGPYLTVWAEHSPEALLTCDKCGRERRADQLHASVYYCWTDYFCKDTEYGRAPWFPFAYERICEGTAWKPAASGERL